MDLLLSMEAQRSLTSHLLFGGKQEAGIIAVFAKNMTVK